MNEATKPIWKMTPNEAWDWICAGNNVGLMTDEEIEAAGERAQQLFGEVNRRLDKMATAAELTGGLDEPDISSFFYLLRPGQIRKAREEAAGRAPWQIRANEWAESQLPERNLVPDAPDFTAELESLATTGDVEQKSEAWYSLTPHGRERLDAMSFACHVAYPQQLRTVMAFERDRLNRKENLFLSHEQAVREALAGGETVPAEVLADYPKLIN